MSSATMRSKISACADDMRLVGVRVLVVDDDDELRASAVEVLESYGGSALQAADGDAGFDVFVAERPDVVVSDLSMPGSDGFRLIRRIRALPAEGGGLTAALAFSGRDDLEAAITAGFHAALRKPIRGESLVAGIVDLLGSRAGHRAATGDNLNRSIDRPASSRSSFRTRRR